MENILKRIHQVVHLDTNITAGSLLILMTVINKAQEIAITKDNSNSLNSNLGFIHSIVDYCFVLNSVSDTQFILIVIAYFIIHIFMISIFIYIHYSRKLPELISAILNVFTIYYALILHIPTFYSSITFIYNSNICTSSYICSDSMRIGVIFMCLINIVSSFLIVSIIIYFGRCEKLMEDNNVLMLDFSIIIRAMMQSIIIVIIVLKSVDQLQVVRFAFIIMNSTVYIATTIKRLNFQLIVIIELTSLIINVSLYFNLSHYELFLVITLGISLILSIQNIINNYYIVMKEQQNLFTIQIFDYVNQIGDKKSNVILAILKKNHSCTKCKSLNHIIECLLRKMAKIKNSQQEMNIVLSSNFIADHAPLKSLLKIIILNPTEIYLKCSLPNLSIDLYKRARQAQEGAIHKNTIRNTGEHISSLDVQSVYNTSYSSGILFPIILETISGKINFWNKLINGYSDIDHYLNESLKTTTKMLKCKKEVEERFDLVNYRLKSSQYTDILSMRIIQLYFSGVYASSFQAYQLEKSIEDLMKNERYKQDELLDNIQLIQNRLIILKSSLIRKRGELINLNLKQLSIFFDENEETLKTIKHCDQLMPPFLSTIHDQLMENYLQRGYSKLMIHGESSFYLTIQGYVQQCSINLFNFFDYKDDFLLNMIITKQQAESESIIFGIDGKILGLTKLFYQDAIRNVNKTQNTHTTKATEQSQIDYNVTDYLQKNPLIQFYIPGIVNQISELRQQIQSTANYMINNLKSYWFIPSNHENCLQNGQLIFSSFKKKSQGSIHNNMQSQRSQTYSRYSYNSLNTQGNLNYDDQDFSSEVRNQISVDGVPLILLHPEVQESLARLVDVTDLQSKSNQFALFYNLQFKTLNLKKSTYGYFILTIKDYKIVQPFPLENQQPSVTQGSLYKSDITMAGYSLSNQKKSSNEISNNIEILSEIQESQDGPIQEVQLMKNVNLRVREAGDSLSQSQILENSFKFQLKQSDRSNLFDSGRQPLFTKPKQLDQDISKDVDKLEQDMQIIKELRLECLEEEQEVENRKIESKSQSIKKNSNLLEKFRSKQLLNRDKVGADFASNPSRTSTNSTSKESLLIVQKLYYNTQLIVPLRKISFFLGLICIGILVCNIINVSIISENLLTQSNQLAILRQPQNINYFFSSEIMQEWYQYLQSINIITLSPFLNQRNIYTLQSMYDYARSSMADLEIAVPQFAQQYGLSSTFSTKFVINEKITFIEYSLQNFYSILYEAAEASYRNNLGVSEYYYPEILTTGVIRLNLLKMMDFHNTLIVTLTEQTIQAQLSVKSYFLSVMIGELFSVFVIIGITLRYWLFIDHIVKSILFLVSRLNENQAQDQINKLLIIKEQLDNQSAGNWKLFNFGEVMYGFSEKKAKKIILKSNAVVNQNNVKAASALYSRIQKTYYLNRNNAALTFTITVAWTAFLMAGFLIHMAKNDNFQPSLTVTLKFVQFRHNMDSLALLAGLIKSEPLVPNYDLSYINQTLACELLIEYKDNLSPLINEVAQVILENANANNVKSRFDTILNYDLCLSATLHALPLCDVSQLTLPYDKKDSYLNIISNGALGYTAAFVKFINQEFDYEIQNLKYNLDKVINLETVNSQQFQNFVLQYFTDLQATMRSFLVLFQSDNNSIADGIISVIQIYYVGFGTCVFVGFILLSIVWVYKQQQKIQSLRQILVLIPVDHILTTNVRSQAKAIHSMLY